ncbi:tetratricopeptide repeat protein [Macellibacteroides fermentans]|uniref:Uncharacterized protein n=1 Tax=Parabacteroides chartae TaxID=1037355 RepID=A0A1T5E8T2_9BACT|nr:tetratricopeptide repeat protein [Parabacteroides chartae]SKB80291.1 Protein of unknown function [Parabacteroides chartae]
MKNKSNSLCEKAELLFNQDKFKEIAYILSDEVLEKEKSAKLYAWRARANYQLELDVDITILYANLSIEKDPNYFMGYFAIACAWEEKNEDYKSIAYYTKTIELNPKYADAYYNRGLALLRIKDKNRAISDFDEAIKFYKQQLLLYPKITEIYVWIGNAYYYKELYDDALENYSKAINSKTRNASSFFYNRALVYFALKNYDQAIIDYTKAIRFKSKYKDSYFINRGNAWKAKKRFNKAIKDYTKAIKIKPDLENAYYLRGLARKENKDTPENIKQDFESYIKFTSKNNNDNEVWTKYAKRYINELDKYKDTELISITNLISKIKDLLRLDTECITHYTSLSVLKSLIIDNSKFRISEGNFINDTSEGLKFFNYIYEHNHSVSSNNTPSEEFMPKPFIGSFVAKETCNNLNLWRFYGKENGLEAKGCAITLEMKKFIENIKNALSNEENKQARLDDENDICFYHIAYSEKDGSNFSIPNLTKKSKKLQSLMTELKTKVKSYKGDNESFLKEDLNSIAFLFKCNDYKNEKEVRLVVKGIEFEKKINLDVSNPKVYIELVPIKDIISQITLGPSVDKVNEWEAVFFYHYGSKGPTISRSTIPYR